MKRPMPQRESRKDMVLATVSKQMLEAICVYQHCHNTSQYGNVSTVRLAQLVEHVNIEMKDCILSTYVIMLHRDGGIRFKMVY